MEHNLWYDSSNEMARLEFNGDFLLSDVALMKEKLGKLLEGKPFKQIVIQMSDTGKVENRETREQANQALKEAGINGIAFVGGSAANRMIAKVLVKTGTINIQGDFFKNT
jgi:hypothetical protein